MAVAILYSTAPLRLMACFSGIVGDWVSGHSFRNQYSSSLPQSTMLSACQSERNCKKLQLERHVAIPRSHNCDNPRLVLVGRSIQVSGPLVKAIAGLWSTMALVIRIVVHQSIINRTVVHSSNNILEPTHAFQDNTSVKHAVSPPIHMLVTPSFSLMLPRLCMAVLASDVSQSTLE